LEAFIHCDEMVGFPCNSLRTVWKGLGCRVLVLGIQSKG